MTREEAIKILELETRQEALSPYLDRPMEKMLDAMIEASRMGASALRAQPAKLDRSRWKGCYTCNNTPGIMLGEITMCIGKRILTEKTMNLNSALSAGNHSPRKPGRIWIGGLEVTMERLTVKRKDGRLALANNDGSSPMRQIEKLPVAIDRLAAYEDTGLEPEDIDALQKRERGLAEMLVNVSCGCVVPYTRLAELAQAEKDGRLVILPPNDPLTLEELRGMDGEPVWIVPMRGSGGFCTWMLVDAEYELCREAHGEMAVFENCGKTWLAYRRKPKELEGGIEVC